MPTNLSRKLEQAWNQVSVYCLLDGWILLKREQSSESYRRKNLDDFDVRKDQFCNSVKICHLYKPAIMLRKLILSWNCARENTITISYFENHLIGLANKLVLRDFVYELESLFDADFNLLLVWISSLQVICLCRLFLQHCLCLLFCWYYPRLILSSNCLFLSLCLQLFFSIQK